MFNQHAKWLKVTREIPWRRPIASLNYLLSSHVWRQDHMVMLNDMDRFHLVMDVIDRVPGLGQRAAGLRQQMVDERLRKRRHTRVYGDDAPDVRDWTWPA